MRAFKHVSDPIEYSVPGTLLEMVAGTITLRLLVGALYGLNKGSYHGDLERLVVLTSLAQLGHCCEGLETTDNEQRLDVVLLKNKGAGLEIFAGQTTVGTNLRSTLGSPCLSVYPLNFTNGTDGLVRVVTDNTRETVVERNWCVATGNAVCHRRASGCVHTTSWGTNVDDTNTHTLLLWQKKLGQVRRCGDVVGLVLLGELSVAQLHCSLEVLVLNGNRNLLRLCNGLQKRSTNDLVLLDTNNRTGGFRCGLQDGPDSLSTLQSCKHTVVGRWCASTLDVAECGDPCVKLALVRKDVLDLLAGDLLQVAIDSALGNNNDGLALAETSLLLDLLEHLLLPAGVRWVLGCEDKVSAGCYTRTKSEPTAVPAHDFNDECTLMADGCGVDRVDSLADSRKRCVAANGGIGHGEIVINGADKTDDVEVSEGIDLLLGELLALDELLEQAGPFVAESVSTGEGAVTTADDDSVNALDNQVLCGCSAALALHELHASCCADESTTFGEKPTDVLPVHLLDHVAALDKTVVALIDSEGLAVVVDGHADDGSHRTVHARRVASAGHDTNSSLLSIERSWHGRRHSDVCCRVVQGRESRK
jgi:hypothetical protein